MQDVSATVAFLRTDSISILHAIAVELPDVFGAEVLPRLGLRDTLNLARALIALVRKLTQGKPLMARQPSTWQSNDAKGLSLMCCSLPART